MSSKILRVVGAIGFVFGMLSTSGISHAQDAMAVKVAPALFEQVVNPGDRFSSTLKVTNPGSVSRTFSFGVEDISGVDPSSQPIFTTSSVPEYGVSNWVSLDQTSVAIPAGGTVSIPFTIEVPKNAGPGGHYGAIFASYEGVHPGSNGAGLGYEVGSLIELRIAGNANEQASLTEFSTDSGFYQSPSVTFKTTIANNGNVLLQPRGPIDVTNMFGQKVGTIIVNDQGASIFPGSSRSFSTIWNGSGFAFGQFTAVVTLNYGDTENKTLSSATSFWVVPVVPIIVVLASIIFFILIFFWSIKKYVRKRINAMIGPEYRRASERDSDEESLLSGSGLPLSRLVFIAIATAVFAIVFLLILFFFFG
jgi:hypothetical protein